MVFGILWAINAVAAAVLGYFFLAGVGDGSVSSSNIGLWSGILIVCAVILIASLVLRKADHSIIGSLVLTPVALGGVRYVLFFAFLRSTILLRDRRRSGLGNKPCAEAGPNAPSQQRLWRS